jgi:hypothetical protein
MRIHEVFIATRVASVVLALGSPARAAESDGKAVIDVRTDAPDLTIGRVTQKISVVAYGSGGTAVGGGIEWEDLCIAPCRLELEPGMHELIAYGDGYTPTMRRFQFREGEQTLDADPGSATLRWTGATLTVLGISALIVGGTMYGVAAATETEETPMDGMKSAGLYTALGGAGGIALGVPLFIAGGSSLEDHPADRQAQSQAGRRALGMAYTGSF